MARRQCKGETRSGRPCKAAPLTDSDSCLAHADAETRESVGFVAANGKGGRKPVPKATEVQRRLVEENAIAVLRPHFRILGFDVEIGEDGPRLVEIPGGGAKLFGTSSKSGAVNVSHHDDLGAMMAAAEKLLDRVHGRPKQQTEISGPEGGPVEVVPVKRQAADHDVRGILQGVGAVREDG